MSIPVSGQIVSSYSGLAHVCPCFGVDCFFGHLNWFVLYTIDTMSGRIWSDELHSLSSGPLSISAKGHKTLLVLQFIDEPLLLPPSLLSSPALQTALQWHRCASISWKVLCLM